MNHSRPRFPRPTLPGFGQVGVLLAVLFCGRLLAADTNEWKVVVENEDLTICEREHPGSSVREFRGVGTIEGEPALVKRVLDDVPAYPQFMPYVVEARILKEEKGGRITYQRISPPLVGERDYTVRARTEKRMKDGLLTIFTRWQAASELGPAPKPGVTRVTLSEGSWLLEPAVGGRTRATYSVFTDSGGSLPAMIANRAGKSAIPRIFAAVRKQAQLPKYQEKK